MATQADAGAHGDRLSATITSKRRARDGPRVEEAFRAVIEVLVIAVEAIGVGVIVLGSVAVSGRYLRQRRAPDAYQTFRANLGRAILLGLEFLVAADIIRTVAVEPTFTNLGILAGIVAIRTFLSFSLDLEISGRWPWQHSGEVRE